MISYTKENKNRIREILLNDLTEEDNKRLNLILLNTLEFSIKNEGLELLCNNLNDSLIGDIIRFGLEDYEVRCEISKYILNYRNKLKTLLITFNISDNI